MTHQIDTIGMSTFFPRCAIQLAHTNRTTANCITDYICVKGDMPMIMSHFKVTSETTYSNYSPRITLNWYDDKGDIFFLKHKSLISNEMGLDDRYDMSQVENAISEWTKVKSLHAEATVHGSSDSDSSGMYSDEHEKTDVHAALDCLAYLDNDSMINLTSSSRDTCAFTSKTKVICDKGFKEITTSGLRIDETVLLIYDYPIKRQLLESVFFSKRFVDSLSTHGIKTTLDLFVLSSYDKCMSIHTDTIENGNLNECGFCDDSTLIEQSVIINTINVLDELISNRTDIIHQTTINKTS